MAVNIGDLVARLRADLSQWERGFSDAERTARTFTDRFGRILGPSPDGHPFDPATGRVFQQPLEAGRGHLEVVRAPPEVLEVEPPGD